MKRYEDYTKDDLMRLLESLTPGGSEFYESPENCTCFVRDRFATRTRARSQLNELLATAEELVSLFDEYGMARLDKAPMGWGDLVSVGCAIDEFIKAIAAAKGEA